MHALTIFNGGVILISHDERFITTVAKEVLNNFNTFKEHPDRLLILLKSSGFAGTEQCRNSMGMSLLTRSVRVCILRFSVIDTSGTFSESHCQQYQGETMNRNSVAQIVYVFYHLYSFLHIIALLRGRTAVYHPT